eukprot:Pgem_evm1s1450
MVTMVTMVTWLPLGTMVTWLPLGTMVTWLPLDIRFENILYLRRPIRKGQSVSNGSKTSQAIDSFFYCAFHLFCHSEYLFG